MMLGAAILVDVRRTDCVITFFWSDQPTGYQRKLAEEANPANGLRIRHSWPGPRDEGAPGAYRITGARPF